MKIDELPKHAPEISQLLEGPMIRMYLKPEGKYVHVDDLPPLRDAKTDPPPFTGDLPEMVLVYTGKDRGLGVCFAGVWVNLDNERISPDFWREILW